MKNISLLSHRKEEPENGILYIVGTPIGNLNDISQRALNILQNVSLVACEDTRQTKKIMNKFNISNKLISFNKHNSLIKIPKIVKDLKEGKSIAIVSDAGMPGICDPGEDIARSVKSEGIDIICIPGACAAITALVSSGLPSSSFVFPLPDPPLEDPVITLTLHLWNTFFLSLRLTFFQVTVSFAGPLVLTLLRDTVLPETTSF
mgnify:CR=1 FL=1